MRKLIYPFSLLVLAGSLFAADPFAGTWKHNAAKSKFAGPDPALKELTVVIEDQGDRAAVTGKGTASDGSPIANKYTVVRTGGEATYSEGAPAPGVSVVFPKRTADTNTAVSMTMKDGKVLETTRGVVSADGKTMRLSVKGTDGQGKPFESVQVFDKQ
jgi:hypothetical protein